ncbi:MAG: YesL family protein [Oscillospiraceae bacterium]
MLTFNWRCIGKMGLFYNYQESGAGVSKNGPKKSRVRIFFEVFGRKFWNIMLLNFIYVLFCIPIFTIGPATAAAFKVLKNYSIEKNAFVWSDFWKSFKNDFKVSFPLGIIYFIALTGAATGIYIYSESMAESQLYKVLLVLTAIVSLIVLTSSFFAFLMASTIKLSVKDIIKNSFILTIVSGWRGIVAAVLAIIIIGLPIFLFLWIQNFLILIFNLVISEALAGLAVAFICYPYVQKYVIEPYYKAIGRDNPEYDYLKPEGMEDVPLFNDKGGEEAPVVKAKTKGKNKKTIS